MLVAAERTLIAGRAWPNVGVQVSGNGVVEAVGPVHTLGTPTHVWPGELLVPGLVDVCAQAVGSLAFDVARGHKPSHALTDVLLQRLRHGITTLGVPVYSSGPWDQNTRGSPRAVVELLCAAAELVGMRVAVLHTCALTPRGTSGMGAQQLCPTAVDLEACIKAFERLVGHILDQRNPLMSWGLRAPLGQHFPADALTGLRLRLSHLPCLIELNTEAPLHMDGMPDISWLQKLNLLDACVSVSLGHHSSPWPQHCQAPHGATLVQDVDSLGVPLMEEGAWALASQKSFDPRLWSRLHPSQSGIERAAQSLMQAASRGGMRALGLRGGALQHGTWADFYTVSLQKMTEASKILRQTEYGAASCAALAHAMPSLTAVRTHIGGRLIEHES